MFKIVGQTEILLLPLRSGLQSDESFPLRRSLLSAREQALLLETDRQSERQSESLFPQCEMCIYLLMHYLLMIVKQ